MSEHFDARTDSEPIRRATVAFVDALLAELLQDLRLAARGAGYALAVHGSRARDIDLLAAPWTTQAVDKDKLLDRLLGALDAKLGRSFVYTTKVRGKQLRNWAEKPHGRQAIIIHLPGMCPEIDLSVMPKVQAA